MTGKEKKELRGLVPDKKEYENLKLKGETVRIEKCSIILGKAGNGKIRNFGEFMDEVITKNKGNIIIIDPEYCEPSKNTEEDNKKR